MQNTPDWPIAFDAVRSDRVFSLNVEPLMDTLKPQSNGALYSNTVIGTPAVDGWAFTFGTARRGLGGLRTCRQRSVYQLHIIRYGTTITLVL